MGLSWWGRCYIFCPISARSCLTLPDKQKLRLKSPVLKKQACPQWKHSFVFNNLTTSQLSQSSLELTVWDQATFGLNDRLLGGARLGSSKSCGSREVGGVVSGQEPSPTAVAGDLAGLGTSCLLPLVLKKL